MKFVFIIYLNRSGSTFLANQLSKINDILVCPEAEILVNTLLKNPNAGLTMKELEKLDSAIHNDRKLKHWNLDIDLREIDATSKLDLFFFILEQYKSSINPKSNTITFKAVDLINYVETLHDYGLLKGLDIYFISLIRDPRAVFNSQRQTYVEYRRKFMNRNPLVTINQWNYLLSRSEYYKFQTKFVILKYEDLVKNLNTVLNQLIRLFGIIEEYHFDSLHGKLRDRIPLDQLSMHPNIADPPLYEKIDSWQIECNIALQELIQKSTIDGLKRMNYKINQPVKPYLIIQLIWIRYKTELLMKDIYRLTKSILAFKVS